jgi:winged helix DNA-binding protein
MRMTNRAIAHARLRNSRIAGPPLASPQDVVGWLGAVQSQDVPGALWGIAQRMGREGPDTLGEGSPTLASVGAAMDEGLIVRTHALRPTWHFLVPAELRWIQALTGGRVHQVADTMYRRLGLGAGEFRRAEAAIRDALKGGRALTRDELAAAVARTGIDLRDNLVITHLAMHAELEALIVSGPRRGKQATYQLVDERIPTAPPVEPVDALRELTIRYFRSHGPALAHDMAWWSGLTVGSIRAGIELAGSALEGRRVDGKDHWAEAGAFDPEPGLIPDPHVLLLPNYDEYLGSYSDYSPIFDPALPQARTVADVLGAHIVVRDGFVVGGWRRALGRDRVTVTVTLLIPLTPAELDALESAAAAFGRFVGLEVELRVAPA